jgi:hypothetical protein
MSSLRLKVRFAGMAVQVCSRVCLGLLHQLVNQVGPCSRALARQRCRTKASAREPNAVAVTGTRTAVHAFLGALRSSGSVSARKRQRRGADTNGAADGTIAPEFGGNAGQVNR